MSESVLSYVLPRMTMIVTMTIRAMRVIRAIRVIKDSNSKNSDNGKKGQRQRGVVCIVYL
ncbi:unnamed protein product [Penicillium olsonii]|nr:unnamed protein product [Penicillium olsonii]